MSSLLLFYYTSRCRLVDIFPNKCSLCVIMLLSSSSIWNSKVWFLPRDHTGFFLGVRTGFLLAMFALDVHFLYFCAFSVFSSWHFSPFIFIFLVVSIVCEVKPLSPNGYDRYTNGLSEQTSMVKKLTRERFCEFHLTTCCTNGSSYLYTVYHV